MDLLQRKIVFCYLVSFPDCIWKMFGQKSLMFQHLADRFCDHLVCHSFYQRIDRQHRANHRLILLRLKDGRLFQNKTVSFCLDPSPEKCKGLRFAVNFSDMAY